MREGQRESLSKRRQVPVGPNLQAHFGHGFGFRAIPDNRLLVFLDCRLTPGFAVDQPDLR
jgi:hypothetical protein